MKKYSRTIKTDGTVGKLCAPYSKVTRSNVFLGKEGYRRYLKTKHWKRVVARAYSIFGRGCLNCGFDKTDIHHLTYEHRGDERADELIPLCRNCHYKLHLGEITL